MIHLTRRETFSAAHRLHNPKLSDEENRRIFGKCNNAFGHGHNYVVEVTVKGRVDEQTGMVMNLVDLKEIINTAVMSPLDHRNLDLDVAYFRDGDVVSTTENLAIFIWKSLKSELEKLNGSSSSTKLHKVKIWETKKNIVEYYGDDEGEP